MRPKIFIFCLFILAASKIALGQTITSNELLSKSRCKSFDCFNDFITSKGFSLSSTYKEENIFVIYRYSSDKRFSADSNEDFSGKNTSNFVIIENGKKITIDIEIYSKFDFQTLKTNFAQLGFTNKIETKSENNKQAISDISSSYKSKSYPNVLLKLHTLLYEVDGLKWTAYRVTVERTI